MNVDHWRSRLPSQQCASHSQQHLPGVNLCQQPWMLEDRRLWLLYLQHQHTDTAGETVLLACYRNWMTSYTLWVKKTWHHTFVHPYLCQMLTDFKNSITCTPCGRFAITWLYMISHHTLTVLLHYLVKHNVRKTNNSCSQFFRTANFWTIFVVTVIKEKINVLCITSYDCLRDIVEHAPSHLS